MDVVEAPVVDDGSPDGTGDLAAARARLNAVGVPDQGAGHGAASGPAGVRDA